MSSKNSLDLDALEREGRPEPLVVTYRSEEFTLLDPVMRPFEEYEQIDFSNVADPVRFLLDDADRERFMALKPTTRALEILFEQATEHYAGVTPGESDGSSTS